MAQSLSHTMSRRTNVENNGGSSNGSSGGGSGGGLNDTTGTYPPRRRRTEEGDEVSSSSSFGMSSHAAFQYPSTMNHTNHTNHNTTTTNTTSNSSSHTRSSKRSKRSSRQEETGLESVSRILKESVQFRQSPPLQEPPEMLKRFHVGTASFFVFCVGGFIFFVRSFNEVGVYSMCNKQGTRIGNDRKRSKKIEKIKTIYVRIYQ